MEDYRKIAIELGQTLISKAPETREDVERMLPELKESEDERIRKELLNYLYDVHDDDEERSKWIAWIEEQANHANFRNKIQVGDKVTRNEDGVLVNLSQLNRVAKKDEQILANSAKTCNDEQKPAWSEEDEEHIKRIIEHFEGRKKDLKTQWVAELHNKEIEWLKSLKDRVQPKQEWNEEDERLFQIVIDILDRENHLGNISHTDLIACVRKLKSLRPQNRLKWSDEDETMFVNLVAFLEGLCGTPEGGTKTYAEWLKERYKYALPMPHWKPSDEQIEVLKILVDTSKGFGHSKILESLYNDLKKLKEEDV